MKITSLNISFVGLNKNLRVKQDFVKKYFIKGLNI